MISWNKNKSLFNTLAAIERIGDDGRIYLYKSNIIKYNCINFFLFLGENKVFSYFMKDQ